MKRTIAFLLTVFLLISCVVPALAANHYIVPDSNARRFTRAELWGWQYEALGYIFNEIFARYGYHFEPGGRYDNYFRAQLWYRPNAQYSTNQEIYKHLMSDIDWYNERLIKEVREEMRALGTTNPGGRPLPEYSYEPPINGAFSSFVNMYFAPNQKLAVYSGPGTHYHRSANGKASVSTNGHVYVGGWENGWLMVMYWTNDNNVRVGYTHSGNFSDRINAPQLAFAYTATTTTRRCDLTDDPVATYQTMTTLPSGTPVTYLSEYVNEYRWAYVEVSQGGTMMRGFIPADAIATQAPLMEDLPETVDLTF